MSLRCQSDKAVRTWFHKEPERRPHLRLMPEKEPVWPAVVREFGWPLWLGVAGVVALVWELVRA